MRPGERTLRLFLQPIEPLLNEPDTTDLVINRPAEVATKRRGRWEWFEFPELTFDRLDAIATLVAAYTEQDIAPATPLCSTALPYGHRVQLCRPPATLPGIISITARKQSTTLPTIDSLAAGGLFNATAVHRKGPHAADARLLELYHAKQWREFFSLAAAAGKTFGICGRMGSGKTHLGKAIIQAVPPERRIITIQDAPEWDYTFPHRNLVHLIYSMGEQGIARVRPEDLMAASLRSSADGIFVQELRDGAAFTFMRALATGHQGLTTWHADSVEEAFDPVVLMVRQHEAGRRMDEGDIRKMLSQLIDIVVHCWENNGTFGISQVRFLAAEAEMDAAA